MTYYPDISQVNATNDLTQLLVYCNTVTGGQFGPWVAWSFFIIALLGSYFAQMRLTGRPKLDVTFASAGFVTVGFSLLMSIEAGLLSTAHVIIFLLISILGAMHVLFSEPE